LPTAAAIRRIAVLDAPSNLGLRPPADGREPGAARMAATLRQHGLMARIRADDAGAVSPPAYSADPDPESGFRNGPGIATFTQVLADRVGQLVDDGFLPVVLGGDCSVMLGPMLALRRRGRYGLVFVDAHDDFSPPRDQSRYAGRFAAAGLDLGLATGHFTPLLSNLDGLGPYVDEACVVHVGLVREPADAEYAQTELFDRCGVTPFPAYEIHGRGAEGTADNVSTVLRGLDLDGFWVHVDAAVLDQSVMPAVDSPNPAGLTADQLTTLLRRFADEPTVAGFDFTIYDPDLDPGGEAAELLVNVITGALTDSTAAR
jgi:arginase